jgi:hypothetical protein
LRRRHGEQHEHHLPRQDMHPGGAHQRPQQRGNQRHVGLVGLQRAMPETATRLGEKLSVKELGRDYRLVLKNLRS